MFQAGDLVQFVSDFVPEPQKGNPFVQVGIGDFDLSLVSVDALCLVLSVCEGEVKLFYGGVKDNNKSAVVSLVQVNDHVIVHECAYRFFLEKAY